MAVGQRQHGLASRGRAVRLCAQARGGGLQAVVLCKLKQSVGKASLNSDLPCCTHVSVQQAVCVQELQRQQQAGGVVARRGLRHEQPGLVGAAPVLERLRAQARRRTGMRNRLSRQYPGSLS